MDTLFEDAAELIEKLCEKPVIFAGLSMGGYIGIRLATQRPELIEKLILMESSAEAEAQENISKYKMLNNLVRTVGYWPVEKQIMNLMFGDSFLEDKTKKDQYESYLLKLKENNRFTITKATEGVIGRKAVDSELAKISCPTLIIVGDEDKPAPIEKSEFLHQNIIGSKLEIIKNAGHTGTLEQPDSYNFVINHFIEN
jgi:pimeloyl-ACP methyl ester carboxylesterase